MTHADAGPVAGEVRRARADLGVELPPHEVGLESLSAVQISALRILSGARGDHAAAPRRRRTAAHGRPRVGHLFVCGFFLGALPFTLFALSETRISSALAGIGNAATPIATVLATMAILPGSGRPVGGSSRWASGSSGSSRSCSRGRRPTGPTSSASRWPSGGASYGIGWTYNRRFLSGVDLGGLSQPAATLLTALVLMVPVTLGWASLQPEGLAACGPTTRRMPARGCGCPSCARSCSASWGRASPTSLQFDVVRGAGPVIGSTITYLIPVVSVLLGVLVLGERLGPWQVVGFVVVLGAAFVINWRPRPPEVAAVREREQAQATPSRSTASAVTLSRRRPPG